MTKSNKQKQREWLTPREVAEWLHVSPITVRNWANNRQLETRLTPGGHRRFHYEQVERFARARAAERGEPLTAQGPQILIVDDEVVVAELLVSLLKEHLPEASFLIAVSGFEAGYMTRSHLPDLIIMDIFMAGIMGFEACKYIKSLRETQHIPIIGMTGYASPDDISKMKASGAESILMKPFELELLYAAVDTALLQES